MGFSIPRSQVHYLSFGTYFTDVCIKTKAIPHLTPIEPHFQLQAKLGDREQTGIGDAEGAERDKLEGDNFTITNPQWTAYS